MADQGFLHIGGRRVALEREDFVEILKQVIPGCQIG